MLRRHLWRWIAVTALAAFAAAAALPAASSAAAGISYSENLSLRACPAIYPVPDYCRISQRPIEYRTASLNHVGWTYLNLNYCPIQRVCAEIYRSSTPAYRWSGTRWVNAQLSQGWVYVYPYSGEWRWAWTQDTGWLAVSGGRFELR